MVAAALVVAGCSGSSGGGGASGGSLASIDLKGQTFKVGSKEFTEQLVLGQIAKQALEATGATVEDKTGIQGTANVRKALTANEIDMYWEYTGTGWTVHLKHTTADAPKDSKALYEAVRTEDLAKNKVAWLQPAPMNNTYAIATAKGRGAQLGVTNLSDFAKLVASRPDQATVCAASEFLTRDDGFPGLAKTYGFTLPKDRIAEVDLGVIYTRIPAGDPCKFGEVFQTDGRILANNLEIINDDKNFFVNYNVAMTVNQAVLDKNPKLADVFNPIAAKLTTEVMRELNERVDVKGELPEAVAKDFLQKNGFIG
ncbi:MAG: hypothetical protein JWR88_362 [Pseudonocardia sp.]|jgi:osmoprotectant transport system substrate-binding protein|nr:hypothetical protein [Pseudonocardia sp.]